jgi:hypothetical protein
MPLSSFGLSSQVGCASKLYVSLLLELFDRLIQEFFSIPHHVDFSVALRVRLQWQLVDWIYCGYQKSQDVIAFIPFRIRACLPQLTQSMSNLCLIYEADSNRGWWEAVGA